MGVPAIVLEICGSAIKRLGVACGLGLGRSDRCNHPSTSALKAVG